MKKMEELLKRIRKYFLTNAARRQANVSLHIDGRKNKYSLIKDYKEYKAEEKRFNRIYAFHQTVRGKMHLVKERPCEDCSGSFSEKNGKYYIAVVADGHGSNECFLSRIGSKIAVDVALDALKNFADSISVVKTDLLAEHSQPSILRQLTDCIVSRWCDRVEEHFGALLDSLNSEEDIDICLQRIDGYPFSDVELQEVKNSKRAKIKPTNFYGTTLMAALWLPDDVLVIVHQGDGRCDVFYDDGTVDQPVPWDSRCIGTAVTSMCDDDAANRIRFCVIRLFSEDQKTEKSRKVIACYLGSDGVEDAYRDSYDEKEPFCMGNMGGVHTFYKDMTCQIIEKGSDKFESYLEEMLPEFSDTGKFSNTGSGDDVSVAGIVDLKAVQNHIKDYEHEIRIYELGEQLFWKEEELRSKMRKHRILKSRMDDAKGELSKIEDSIFSSKEKVKTAQEKFVEAQKKYIDYDANYQRIEIECKQIKSKIEEVKRTKIEENKVNEALA